MWQRLFAKKWPAKLGRLALILHFGLLVSITLSGCVGRKGDPRVTPLATARDALETALKAWQNGQPHGKLESTSPPIEVVDSVWKKGEKLKSFDSITEETDPDGLRWFSVRLRVGNAISSDEAYYVVMGQTSLKVFRKEDYDLSRSWKGVGDKKDAKKKKK
jgi:hypothetical protein